MRMPNLFCLMLQVKTSASCVVFLFIILEKLTVIDEFTFGKKTGAKASCSATINGKMMIFGGSDKEPFNNQISLVESCQLTRLGDLPMNFFNGGCKTFQTSSGTEETLLCFGKSGQSSCHR